MAKPFQQQGDVVVQRDRRVTHSTGAAEPLGWALARFARALHTAIKKGRGDPTFSPREKVPRKGG